MDFDRIALAHLLEHFGLELGSVVKQVWLVREVVLENASSVVHCLFNRRLVGLWTHVLLEVPHGRLFCLRYWIKVHKHFRLRLVLM